MILSPEIPNIARVSRTGCDRWLVIFLSLESSIPNSVDEVQALVLHNNLGQT